jgi:hypothetical protein
VEVNSIPWTEISLYITDCNTIYKNY